MCAVAFHTHIRPSSLLCPPHLPPSVCLGISNHLERSRTREGSVRDLGPSSAAPLSTELCAIWDSHNLKQRSGQRPHFLAFSIISLCPFCLSQAFLNNGDPSRPPYLSDYLCFAFLASSLSPTFNGKLPVNISSVLPGDCNSSHFVIFNEFH